jgi:hypothetical protein
MDVLLRQKLRSWPKAEVNFRSTCQPQAELAQQGRQSKVHKSRAKDKRSWGRPGVDSVAMDPWHLGAKSYTIERARSRM